MKSIGDESERFQQVAVKLIEPSINGSSPSKIAPQYEDPDEDSDLCTLSVNEIIFLYGDLQVVYGNGEHEVKFGNELTPTQVKEEPTVEWEADENAYYLLCLTDPDAPSRAEPAWREWHHWLVGNIPGTDIGLGETLSAYIGSAPPPETGLHRYTFLVYKQPDKLEFDEKRLTNQSPDNRAGFSISKFAEKYNLGDPVAGNFYLAEFDDWCAEIYKRFGISF